MTATHTMLAAASSIGKDVIAGTQTAEQSAIHAARAIATFLEKRRQVDVKIDLGNGAGGALDKLHRALGSSLTAQSDQISARLAMFGLLKQVGLAYGEECPCGEGFAPVGITSEHEGNRPVVPVSAI